MSSVIIGIFSKRYRNFIVHCWTSLERRPTIFKKNFNQNLLSESRRMTVDWHGRSFIIKFSLRWWKSKVLPISLIGFSCTTHRHRFSVCLSVCLIKKIWICKKKKPKMPIFRKKSIKFQFSVNNSNVKFQVSGDLYEN